MGNCVIDRADATTRVVGDGEDASKESMRQAMLNVQIKSWNDYREKLSSNHEDSRSALFLSNHHVDSGYWLGEYRRSGPGTLEGAKFVAALRMRLLLPAFSDREGFGQGMRCQCGSRIDMRKEVFHHLDCRNSRWYVRRRHDAVVMVIAELLGRKANVEVEIEPDIGGGRKADIRLVCNHVTTLLDVVISNPAAPSHRRTANSHRVENSANNAAEGRKRDSFRGQPGLRVDGANANFFPLAFESTGRIGMAALAFLQGYCVDDLRIQMKTSLRKVGSLITYFGAAMTDELGRHSEQLHIPRPVIINGVAIR